MGSSEDWPHPQSLPRGGQENVAFLRAPLCPAGHLPHEGRPIAYGNSNPSPVLRTTSPQRGEEPGFVVTSACPAGVPRPSGERWRGRSPSRRGAKRSHNAIALPTRGEIGRPPWLHQSSTSQLPVSPSGGDAKGAIGQDRGGQRRAPHASVFSRPHYLGEHRSTRRGGCLAKRGGWGAKGSIRDSPPPCGVRRTGETRGSPGKV